MKCIQLETKVDVYYLSRFEVCSEPTEQPSWKLSGHTYKDNLEFEIDQIDIRLLILQIATLKY